MELTKEVYERAQQKRVRRTKEELKEFYIDPVQMEMLIEEFYSTGHLSDELADMIQKIAARLALARNFYNYSFKTDMQGDAIIKMMKALRRKRFKCGSGYSPFSYFTKVAYRAFLNRITREKKEHEALAKYREEVYCSLMSDGQLPAQKNTSGNAWNSDDD